MKVNSLIISLGVILIVLISGCAQKEVESSEQLSELQITACNAADKGNTCDTRLPELGIVTKEECCNILGKCCGGV